ncbi:4Fe-4S cluster-binding domain-containing protein [uncultured Methanobrevibacter sp.]|uniref:4Fe-4S cluster-binding domain-containing protein n=1 Tax=uncultured Methanobrevibacter sp. TaxID=253161 RepID=UPI0025EF9478|nr:4Fe-4S cluster-binding domain-containing protein [uncultured Methanobrevibacter sp.]
MTVRVTNIQHFSLHDGPGIRTTVFLKGCNLNCPWCCNPENISFEIEKYVENGLKKEFGYDISLNELEKEILKDEIYYDNGKGGVTFSGGEPLLQIENIIPLLKHLKNKGINICFETSLSINSNLVSMAIDYIDELFIDIKILENEEALNVLNLNLDLYLKNLEIINHSNIKKENITFRIPLNNEYTLNENNINQIINLLKKYPYKVQIFKTHNLAENKYRLINKKQVEIKELSDNEINEVYDKIKEITGNVEVISI